MDKRSVRLGARRGRDIAVIGEVWIDKRIGPDLTTAPQPALVNRLVVVYACAIAMKLGATNDLTETLINQNWRVWWMFRTTGG